LHIEVEGTLMDAGGAVRGASGIGNAGLDARAAAGVRRLEPAPPLTFCLRRLIGGASLTSCVYDSSVGLASHQQCLCFFCGLNKKGIIGFFFIIKVSCTTTTITLTITSTD
jgi:hypothetical protein